MTAEVAGVVLAAGASSRAGACKALHALGGTTLVERAVATLVAGGCRRVIVVVGPPHGVAVAAACRRAEVAIAHNPAPERGMLSSLQVALPLVREAAAVVALVDHPRVLPGTVERLIEAWAASGAAHVTPSYGGRGGHPHLVDRAVFAALLGAPVEGGARPVLSAVDRLRVDVDDPAVIEDLDTAAQLARAGAAAPPGSDARG